jgi:hypothetical protein
MKDSRALCRRVGNASLLNAMVDGIGTVLSGIASRCGQSPRELDSERAPEAVFQCF